MAKTIEEHIAEMDPEIVEIGKSIAKERWNERLKEETILTPELQEQEIVGMIEVGPKRAEAIRSKYETRITELDRK